MNIEPVRLMGDWKEGYALDYHAARISYEGDNIFGYPEFNYKYTEIGEMLYYLKEFDEYQKCIELSDITADFLKKQWQIIEEIDGIIVVPTSKSIHNAPLHKLAKMIGHKISKPVSLDFFSKLTVDEIKILNDQEKMDIYKNNIKKEKKLKNRGNILIIDDFYNTGTTLKCVAGLIKEDINLDDLYVLTIVKNRKID
ncbi:MAG: ComF family protein [Fusobacteriaceae bacterium]|nr:ComF family protein [Fusobacteriaceae bacterium]